MVDSAAPRLVDSAGRHLEYLRLSVTERCNFRCSYCLPHGSPPGVEPHPLSVDEIERLVLGFADLGFWKVRLTGGEPTLRQDILEIVARLGSIPGVRHLSLTTNGYRLQAIARALARAGLTCLNVSVDSLAPGRFAALTGSSTLERILAGVDAALAAGIPRVKLNAVLLAGTDAAEIDSFLSLARDAPLAIRFIELMETGGDPEFFARNHVPAAAIERLLVARGWSRLPHVEGGGPAVEYGRPGHRGRIGVIAPYREGFCRSCNRLRVSASGNLKLCLFDHREVPLRHLLSPGNGPRTALSDAIRAAVQRKPASHHLGERQLEAFGTLSSIGG
jgi:cyclic pyranopterin phosphate synthase